MSEIKYGSNVTVYQVCNCKKELTEHRMEEGCLKCKNCKKKCKPK